MAGNTIGDIFRLTTFGESHGIALGGIIDGFPPNIIIDFDLIKKELSRRKAKTNFFETARTEADEVEFLSGIVNNTSLGTPIGFIVKNTNSKSSDYQEIKEFFRPSHADFTYQMKYGIRDYRGGGRASGRETVSRIVGGAFAKILLQKFNIEILGYVHAIGTIAIKEELKNLTYELIENSVLRCPCPETSKQMLSLLEETKQKGETIGGIIKIIVNNLPIGLGEPVFDKLQADVAKAIFSIGTIRGVEFGNGFELTKKLGSETLDFFELNEQNKVTTKTNHAGGINGGISNGNQLVISIASKPIPSIQNKIPTINLAGEQKSIELKGRHDVCILPRMVPVAEAMTAIILADHLLKFIAYKNFSM